MSFRETVRIVQTGQRRIKIFVDFWNTVINARKLADFKIDLHWDKIAWHLVSETSAGYGDESHGTLAGCYIFGSYSKSNATENAFVNETLDRYGSLPSLFFDFKERVKKETSNKCPSCKEPISRSSELGVDVLLTVEMIKHASMREHDYLSLISSDRDFLPLFAYLKDQGQRVIHAAPGDAHRDMRSLTWKQIELADHFPQLSSIIHEDRIILSTPHTLKKLRDAEARLNSQKLKYKAIDITDSAQISDKDLAFILNNQNIFFHLIGESQKSYPRSKILESLKSFRLAIKEGQIEGPLPYVILNGQMEAYAQTRGWIRNGHIDTATVWNLVD